MTKSERAWCLVYALVLAAFTTVPYVLAYAAQAEAWRFTGFVFGVEDGNSYIAKMLLGSGGAWLFRTPYTADPQRGVLAFLLYLLLGKLAQGAALHEQLVALFHLFRIAATPLAVLATYRFAAFFLEPVSWRRWATVLATAGGGLGWLVSLAGRGEWLGSLPLDLISPESFGFLAFFGLPHLVLGRALLLGGLVFYLEAARRPARGWVAGGLWLALGLVQPFEVVSAYVVVASHLLAVLVAAGRTGWRQQLQTWLRPAAQAALIPLPIVLYTGLSYLLDPYLQAWSAQNLIASPHPLHYLAAYGLVLVPAVAGGRALIRSRRAESLLPVAWCLSLPVLAYAPVNLQRRLPEGIWVAFATLAAIGLSTWTAETSRKRVAPLLLALSMATSVLLLAGGAGIALRPGEPVFRPASEVAAFEWCRAHAQPGSVVLTSYETGNALPAWAPVRVVVGHGPESAGLQGLLPQVSVFFSEGEPDSARVEFLAAHNVSYVLVGPRERALGSWNPGGAPFLTLVYQDSGYELYRVDFR